MASLTAYGGLAYFLANRGSPKTTAAPPINASSPDEADFIKYTPESFRPASPRITHADTDKQEIHGASGGRRQVEGETLDKEWAQHCVDDPGVGEDSIAGTNCTTIDRPRAGQLKIFLWRKRVSVGVGDLMQLHDAESERLEQQCPTQNCEQ